MVPCGDSMGTWPGTTESFRLEKPSEVTKSNPEPPTLCHRTTSLSASMVLEHLQPQ